MLTTAVIQSLLQAANNLSVNWIGPFIPPGLIY